MSLAGSQESGNEIVMELNANQLSDMIQKLEEIDQKLMKIGA